ncbi:LpxI family protein [Paracoccaceae bacterium GXU_MW_L88]
MSGLAIIAGEGDLPRLLAEHRAAMDSPYLVVGFQGLMPKWSSEHPHLVAQYEKPGAMFKAMREANCDEVCYAGAMVRPKLNPLKFDWKFLKLAGTLLPALKKGDDETLRAITKTMEGEGFTVVGAHDILENLVMPEGCPTTLKPSDADKSDAARAAEIVAALGQLDVGQGAVVGQGLALGVESISGTDAMLEAVTAQKGAFLTDADGAKGLLYKAPKPGQDWRADLPAIGVETVRKAAEAGLAGVVIAAGGVIVLDRDAVIREADAHGLFLWARS